MAGSLALEESWTVRQRRRATVSPVRVAAKPEDDHVERLEVAFGPGDFGPLDSDDIDAMIASGEAWMPDDHG